MLIHARQRFKAHFLAKLLVSARSHCHLRVNAASWNISGLVRDVFHRAWRASEPSSTHAPPPSYLEFVVSIPEGCHMMVPVSANQLAQGADQLLVGHTVHVDLLVLVLRAHYPPQMGVQQRLDETVTSEGLLVGVGGLETLVAVGHLAGDAGLHGLLRRVLLAELTLHPVAGGRHGSAVGDGSLAPRLFRGVGPTLRRLLVAVDDVLKRDVAFESL